MISPITKGNIRAKFVELILTDQISKRSTRNVQKKTYFEFLSTGDQNRSNLDIQSTVIHMHVKGVDL